MTAPNTWVLGAGGLLGSSTVRAMARQGRMWAPEAPLKWTNSGIVDQLDGAIRQFIQGTGSDPWQIAWCAGAATPTVGLQSVGCETVLVDHFLQSLDAATTYGNRDGSVFIASSAGGVYAGSRGAPFTESSPTSAISPYGHSKLRLEASGIRWSQQTGIPVLIGRISNIFGPAQNLFKSQGLISQICRAHLLNQPISIYVPLDTIRDYIFADDCANIISDSMNYLRTKLAKSAYSAHIKVIASQQSVTIGLLVAELSRIFKRAPRVVYGESANSRLQPLDLRLRSEVWPEMDQRALTPLPVGIWRTVAEMTRVLQAGRLR